MPRKKKPKPVPEPIRELTDEDFQEMVEYAREMAERPLRYRVPLSRFAKIRAFKIDLRDITEVELLTHLKFVISIAKPFPS